MASQETWEYTGVGVSPSSKWNRFLNNSLSWKVLPKTPNMHWAMYCHQDEAGSKACSGPISQVVLPPTLPGTCRKEPVQNSQLYIKVAREGEDTLICSLLPEMGQPIPPEPVDAAVEEGIECSTHPLVSETCFNMARLWAQMLCDLDQNQHVQPYCEWEEREEGSGFVPMLGLYGSDSTCGDEQEKMILDRERCFAYEWVKHHYGPWQTAEVGNLGRANNAFKFECSPEGHLRIRYYFDAQFGECNSPMEVYQQWPTDLCLDTGKEECAIMQPPCPLCTSPARPPLPPLPPSPPLTPQPVLLGDSAALSAGTLLAIVCGVGALLLVVLIMFFFYWGKRKPAPSGGSDSKSSKQAYLLEGYDNTKKKEGNKQPVLALALNKLDLVNMDCTGLLKAIASIEDEISSVTSLAGSVDSGAWTSLSGSFDDTPSSSLLGPIKIQSIAESCQSILLPDQSLVSTLQTSSTTTLQASTNTAPSLLTTSGVEVVVDGSPNPDADDDVKEDQGAAPLLGDVLDSLHGKQYQLISPIGQGSTSYVYYAKEVGSQREFAIKVPRSANEDISDQFQMEYHLMASVQHHRVVQEEDVALWGTRRCLVMEYCSLNTVQRLVDVCIAQKSKISEIVIHKVVLQLAQALQFLHSNQIIHRDIKLSNVFITSTNNLKLGDFGLSRKVDGVATTMVGTPLNMAPEVLGGLLNKQEYGVSSDIWSLGSMVFELLTLHPLFNVSSIQSLFLKHSSLQEHQEDIINTTKELGYCVELVDLLCRMLQEVPENRITAQEILTHPFITKNLPEYVRNQRHDLAVLNNAVDFLQSSSEA